jgi:hypothetical protein
VLLLRAWCIEPRSGMSAEDSEAIVVAYWRGELSNQSLGWPDHTSIVLEEGQSSTSAVKMSQWRVRSSKRADADQ